MDSGTDNQLHVNPFQVVIQDLPQENIPAIINNFRDLNKLFPENSPDVVENNDKMEVSFEPDEYMAELDIPFYVDLPDLVLPDLDDDDLHDFDDSNCSYTGDKTDNWIDNLTEEELQAFLRKIWNLNM